MIYCLVLAAAGVMAVRNFAAASLTSDAVAPAGSVDWPSTDLEVDQDQGSGHESDRLLAKVCKNRVTKREQPSHA